MVRADVARCSAGTAGMNVAPDRDSPKEVLALLGHPGSTPLLEVPSLAMLCDVAEVFVKAERCRQLGSFKSLGGLYAALRALTRATGAASIADMLEAGSAGARLPCLICASDGNHGLAVAAAAQLAGAPARIFLPNGLSACRVERIRQTGATIAHVYGTYDDAVAAATAAAAPSGGLLIADTSDRSDDLVVSEVVQGYGVIANELRDQLSDRAPPTHLFVQAGVGGLAASLVQGLYDSWQPPSRFIVVEPKNAACVTAGLCAASPVPVAGDLMTRAEMLSCGLASRPALDILSKRVTASLLVTEHQLAAAQLVLTAASGSLASASGAAGLAGLLAAASSRVSRDRLGLDQSSRVLLIETEGSDGAQPMATLGTVIESDEADLVLFEAMHA